MATSYDHRFILGPHSPMSVPLQRLLGVNRDALREVGTEFPKAKRHREVLEQTLGLAAEDLADASVHRAYINSVLEHADTKCVIYSYDAFLGSRKNAIKAGFFYPSLEAKIAPLRQLTQGHQATLFLCLQHFTQFVEMELIRSPHLRHIVDNYPKNLDLSWVHFVHRMREAWPEAFIVIIDADELATNWASIAALMTGHAQAQAFNNIEKFPLGRLAEDGRKPYLKAFEATPPESVAEWTERTSQFFAEYGRHVPVIRKVIASPWAPEQVQHSKMKFKADLTNFAAIDNVVLASDLGLQPE